MRKLKISPAFLLVFSSVLSLTMLSGGTSLWLASQPKLSEYQVRVLENSTATWQTGVGAIFGLLGSKATQGLLRKSLEAYLSPLITIRSI